MLSPENCVLVERVFADLAPITITGNFSEALNRLLDAAREEGTRSQGASVSAVSASLPGRPDEPSPAGWRPYNKFAVQRGDEVWVRAKACDVCTSCLFVTVDTIHAQPMANYVRPRDVLLPPAENGDPVSTEPQAKECSAGSRIPSKEATPLHTAPPESPSQGGEG